MRGRRRLIASGIVPSAPSPARAGAYVRLREAPPLRGPVGAPPQTPLHRPGKPAAVRPPLAAGAVPHSGQRSGGSGVADSRGDVDGRLSSVAPDVDAAHPVGGNSVTFLAEDDEHV